MPKGLQQHEVILRPSEWLALMNGMRHDRYREQQRSKWIQEALLLHCAFWPQLSSYCTGPEARIDTTARGLKVTIHPLIDVLVLWTFFRPHLAPRRLEYSRIVGAAIALRETLGFDFQSTPGAFLRDFVDSDVEAFSIGAHVRPSIGSQWIEDRFDRLFVQRSMHLFSARNRTPSRSDAGELARPGSQLPPPTAFFYERALDRLTILVS